MLRARRQRVGLTQAELARRAGVSVRTVRHVERGDVSVRADSSQRLADVVGLGAATRPPGFRLAVLGSLEVTRDGQRVPIRAAKHRALLAVLALGANTVVRREEIVDVLWGESPPQSCANLVHTYVSALRRALGSPGRIASVQGGYRLLVDATEFDLLRFDQLAATARSLEDERPAEAMAAYAEAVRCWRAPLLADLPDAVRGHPVTAVVTNRRVGTVLRYADLALRQQRGGEVVEQLTMLANEEPLHEDVHARLMLALAASGRQAAALRLFGVLRRRLDEELGVEPGREIRAAYERIIQGAEKPPEGAGRPPVPAQLLADVGGFVGHAAALGQLDSVLGEVSAGRRGTMAVAMIVGTPGVGKTSVAVHWAHRVRDRFPDGQLHVNLRGYAKASPMRPIEALARFLAALGVPPHRVPAEVDEAAGLFRSLLADRRVLVLLDNACTAEQVRPLLPGGAGNLVLVTSRDRLGGLVATEGARSIVLDVLEPAESRSLLEDLLGAERAEAEPEAVVELAAACAHLPLALRIAGANLAASQGGVGEYVRAMRSNGRLRELAIGDDTAVRAAFDLSYHRLGERARRLFRLLGSVPGPDFTIPAAAALLGSDVATARSLVGALAEAHLVQRVPGERYQFHDLLREYAVSLVDEHGGDPTALDGLYQYYLRAAGSAAETVYPTTARIPARDEPARAVRLTEEEAIAWLDAERPNLCAAAVSAAANGRHRYAWLLASTLREYFRMRGFNSDGLAVGHAALAAAREKADRAAEAAAYDMLGLLYYNLSDYRRSFEMHTDALALRRGSGDRFGEAASLHCLGRVLSHFGRPAEQARHHESALELNRELGDARGEAESLNYLGVALLKVGDPRGAGRYAGRALALSGRIGDRELQAKVLHNLGVIRRETGTPAEAMNCFVECGSLFTALGDRHGEAGTAVCLAEALCDAGRYAEADERAWFAVRLGQELGERRQEVGGRDVLGVVRLRTGRAREARAHFEEALGLSREVEFGYGLWTAELGLSEACRADGRHAEALERVRRAVEDMHEAGARLLDVRADVELAWCHTGFGDLERAEEFARRAERDAHERGQRLMGARASNVLGHVLARKGEHAAARAAWQAALVIFAEAGAPEADQVRNLLT
ncbi:BTAD domain-containing putative transcriptional regulator [Amycolatopsis sp. CA-230715]|uniref:BTAD domain-containing putative transcriptional regulator n=1 Tax=Amycolatopsis sp. CA-230715 TaxID=2745196 RepID=UPI002110E941|nr:BTAD domain-containing putative transcriptional regulator [Amycolatopsis sp. CA-230715]